MLDNSKKTIIFDFGNVLIDLHFERCFSNFENLLNVDWSSRKLPESVLKAMYKYDRGQISDEIFMWAFQQYNAQANQENLIKAWCSLLGEIKAERLEMLQELSDDYNLCILSNINNLHISYIHKYLESNYQISDFEDRFFNQVFYSHIIGRRKPDEEVYAYVTDALGIQVSDVLFIDDMTSNVEAAKKYGWNAIKHDPKTEIVDMINTYLGVF